MRWMCLLAVSAAMAQPPAPVAAPPPAPPLSAAPAKAAPPAESAAKVPPLSPAKATPPAESAAKAPPLSPAKAAPPAEPAAKAPPLSPAEAAPPAEPAAKAPPLSPADAMRASVEKQRKAIEDQRKAVRQQAESAGVWLKPGDPSPPLGNEPAAPEVSCEPLGDAIVAPLIESTAKAQEIPQNLLRAVMERESGFRPCAVSSKGAQGLMQLMPDTALELGVKDPFDPKESVSAGARYLKQLMDRYKGDLPKTLGAYNAGPSTVDQAGGLPDILETKEYVDAILKKLGAIRTVPPSDPTPKPTGN